MKVSLLLTVLAALALSVVSARSQHQVYRHAGSRHSHRPAIVLREQPLTDDDPCAAPAQFNGVTNWTRANGTSYSNDTSAALLPSQDQDVAGRQAELALKQAGYIYGPSLIGPAAPFPNGTLGNTRVNDDTMLWAVDRTMIDGAVKADAMSVMQAIMANGGLKTMDDYANVLYSNQWTHSNPRGTAPGIMTNYTQDLLFSMERLSQNPYSLERVPSLAALAIKLNDSTVARIVGVPGTSLASLQNAGALFVVDYIYQKDLPKTTVPPARYGAACTALFYIHPTSRDFLPMAIKTNEGADLTYTPLDTPADWLYAKMLFNVNDMFHSQMFHLVVTHDVSEALHLAALRTLSQRHPVLIIMERLMLQGFSSRPVGEWMCFKAGCHWDQLLYINGEGCRMFVAEQWATRGGYESSYLFTDLASRGIVSGANNSHPFKSFPWLDDALAVHTAQEAFFTAFVDSYYPNDAAVAGDVEIAQWALETAYKANVYDFPDQITTKKQLVDVLTHFAYIVSVVHHSLNGGDPVGSKATLPFHAPALFAPVPTSKGLNDTDLLRFMPQPAQAIHYIGFIATFNRPFYGATNRTLEATFLGDAQLTRLNAATNAAAQTFMTAMHAQSVEVRSRTFDSNGLSQGMPFIFRTLDPGYIPFFSAV